MGTTGTRTEWRESTVQVENLLVDDDLTVVDDGSIGGDLAVTGTITGTFSGAVPHGQMYEYDLVTPSTITVTTAGTYYGWASATEFSAENGVTFESNAAGDRLNLTVVGEYEVCMQVSFGGTGGAIVDGGIHKKGVLQEQLAFRRKLGTGGDVGSASLTGFVYSDGTDYIDLRLTSDDNGDALNINVCSVQVNKI